MTQEGSTEDTVIPSGRIILEEVDRLLSEYTFPGSVRELEHLIERTAIHAKGRAITRDFIEHELTLNKAPSTELSAQHLFTTAVLSP